MIEGVINELSFRKPPEFSELAIEAENSARKVMSDLIRCVSEGMRRRLICRLRTDAHFATADIAPQYSLAQWRNDQRVNRDERALFRSFITASPYLTAPEQEVTFHGVVAAGLASCALGNSVAISANSDDLWNTPQLDATMLALEEDGSVSSNPLNVRNVAALNHWNEHAEWSMIKQRTEIRSGPDLIRKAAHLFQHLILGEHAKNQLSLVQGTEHSFAWVVEALTSAEAEMNSWLGGPFPHQRLPGPASGESETVNKSARLRAMRTFETDRGVVEYCEHHMKYMGQNQRIHYILRSEQRKMLIAYIGEHLETARH